jgi:hypothetical protein
MFSFFYKFLKNLYTNLPYLNKQNINLDNSVAVFLMLKSNMNKSFYFNFKIKSNKNDNDNDNEVNNLFIYLKNTVLSSFKYLKSNSSLFFFFSKILQLKTNILYFIAFIIIVIFLILYAYEFYNVFTLLNILKFNNTLIFYEKNILNSYLFNILKDNNINLDIHHEILGDIKYHQRILKGFMLSDALSLAFFKYKPNDEALIHYYINILALELASIYVVSLSNIALDQYINIIMTFYIKNNFLLVNAYRDGLFNFITDFNLLNNLKNYLFWFSWGLFYNKLFYYYYLKFNIIEFSFYNYFFYKIDNLKFIFDIETQALNYEYDNILIEKSKIYKKSKIILSDLYNYASSTRWVCFQHYLSDDLVSFYNNEINNIDYMELRNVKGSPRCSTYMGSFVDTRKFTKISWLSFNSDYRYWSFLDYYDEDFE